MILTPSLCLELSESWVAPQHYCHMFGPPATVYCHASSSTVVTWQCRGSTQAYWDIPWHSCLEDHALTLYCHAEFSLFSCGSSHLWPWQYPLFVVAVQVFWSIWCVAGATWGIIFKPYPVTISQQRIMLEQTAKLRCAAKPLSCWQGRNKLAHVCCIPSSRAARAQQWFHHISSPSPTWSVGLT